MHAERAGGCPYLRSCRKLDVSERWLHRHFRHVAGVSPKLFHRLARARKVLAAFNTAPDIDWSDEALRHGYYDQSHLIGDFRSLYGLSPADCIRRQSEAAGYLTGP
jgi:AraC-like DNA-binding protein